MSQKSRARHVALAAFLVFCASTAFVFSQATTPDYGKQAHTKGDPIGSGGNRSAPFARVLVGTWTYRSFINDPDVNKPFNDIQFGAGALTIQSVDDGVFRGRLDFGPDQQLALKGSVTYGNPPTLRFQGVGDKKDSKDWVYDYQAYYVLDWPHGADQRPALVGSVIRTQPHSGGKAKAGVVASFVAVRQDGGKQTLSSLLQMRIDPFAYRPGAPDKRLVNAFSKASSIRVDEAALPAPQRLSLARAAKEALKVAPVKRSKAGRLDYELVVDYLDSKIGDDPVRLRTYNKSLVGPTLRVKAGDTLYITLENKLPPEKDTGHMNEHHGWNTTNLHFHGLHVAPQGKPTAESDNVLLEVGPGKTQKYEVRIPPDHVAGTFWYHAHKHGSTSAQVSSGMAGALIVEREDDLYNLDSVKEIKDAQEQILVFQQTPYLIKGGKGVIEIDPNPATAQTELNLMFGPNTWHKSKHFTTVNGQRLPVLNLKQGEVQRWRLIHSGFRENLRLNLVKDPGANVQVPVQILFNEIAVDGLALGKINTTDTVELFPGNRSDVLVQAPTVAGTYYLIDATATAVNTLFGTEDKNLSFIAKVVVGKDVSGPMALPTADKLIKHRLPSIDPATVTGLQQAYYGITSQGFLIGDQDPPPGQELVGSEFDLTNPRTLPLNGTQQWTIGTRNFNDDHTQGPTHPFHIHTNPFEVVSIKDPFGHETLQGGPVWRDTMPMLPGYTITFLTRYKDFSGSFVQHCHILDHEDQGMMQLIRIDDPKAKKGDGGASKSPSRKPLGVFKDLNGKNRRLDDYLGRPVVLVCSRGLGCGHCMSQLKAFADREADFRKMGVELVFVTPDAAPDLRSGLLATPFVVLSDPDLFAFRKYGNYQDGPLHGVVLLDALGKMRWQKTGVTPFMDVDAILNKTATVFAQDTGPTPAPEAPLAEGAEKEVIGASPAQWKYQSDSTLTRPATIAEADGRMMVRVKSGDVISFKVASGNHAVLFENAKTEQDAGIWEVVADSGTLGLLPDGKLPHYDHKVARVSTANTGNLIKIRIKNLKAGVAILFGCNPHSESPDGTKVSMLGAIVLDAPNNFVAAQDTAAVCQCLPTSTLPRVRKNIDCLTDQELRKLEHAFKILQDRSQKNPSDKTGYDYQVTVHRRFCAHNTELIWPWHRAFLLYFEELLRAADPDHPDTPTKDVTLPYWDWSKPASGVAYPKAYENPASPLFHAGRTKWDATNPFPLFTDTDIGLDVPDWYLFGGTESGPGQLEAGMIPGVSHAPHNDGHGQVGGDMCCPNTSVKDPIFWAHHANLDRLWDLWQQRWKANPVQQTATLLGFPATATPAPVVSNFNDIRGQLKYDYCNPVTSKVVDLPLARAAKDLMAKLGQPLSLTFNPKNLRAAPRLVRHSRAQIRLSGVKTPVDTTYRAKVFLHPANVPAKSDDPEFVRKYQAGGFTLWAMGHDHEPENNPKTLNLNLDVTPKYEELVHTLPAGTPLTVTFDFTTGYGSERRPAQYGQRGIEFGQARLVVNPQRPSPSEP
jgi:FtsP/CotA-like multicopper oxidase with cupredoxin domain/peroxiredoxin